MIIEGAFYKLPELLLGHPFPKWQYEATLSNHLAMAVLLELNARNIPMPQSRIHVERPYPLEKAGPANRADLFVDLGGVFTHGLWLAQYGIKANNWIETKFYGGIGRTSGNEPKTKNTGELAQDLLRLCVLVKEERSAIRDNGRYMLVVFNREPGSYIAYQRQSQAGTVRMWLRDLLSPGRHDVKVTSEGEAATFVKHMGTGVTSGSLPLELELDVLTYAFEPSDTPSDFLYWGYLLRIINFTVRIGPDELAYDDNGDTVWTEEQAMRQQQLAEKVTGMTSGEG